MFCNACHYLCIIDWESDMNLRRAYRALLAESEILVSAGVYDAFSARNAEVAGFKALVAGGNAGIGGLLAGPDMGQTNMRDMADLYARICAAVEVPVAVDADTGYGGVHNVRQAVRAFEAAGVAAMTINDQTFPNRCGYLSGKSLIPVEEMLAKIKAATDARVDTDMIIVARTDAANVDGVTAALDRCHMFLEAGADIAKPQCVDDEAGVARVVAELGCPYLATLSSAAGKNALDIADLQRLGAASVSLPSISIFAAMMGMRDIFSAVKKANSIASAAARLPSLKTYYDTVRLDDFQEREDAFAAFAKGVVASAEKRGQRGR
jgi:2-methylisocitrate lyase-like PEP mutase family enzyme